MTVVAWCSFKALWTPPAARTSNTKPSLFRGAGTNSNLKFSGEDITIFYRIESRKSLLTHLVHNKEYENLVTNLKLLPDNTFITVKLYIVFLTSY